MAISDELRKQVDPNNECCCKHCLSSKCKEWAFSKGYTILTEYVNQNGVFSYVVSNKQSIENYGYLENVKVLNYIPHNKTEYEAIIKACEWILSQEGKNEN